MITSYVQGLKDIVQPIQRENLQAYFDAIPFFLHKFREGKTDIWEEHSFLGTNSEINAAMDNAFDLYKNHPDRIQNAAIIQKVLNSPLGDLKKEGGCIAQLFQLYQPDDKNFNEAIQYKILKNLPWKNELDLDHQNCLEQFLKSYEDFSGLPMQNLEIGTTYPVYQGADIAAQWMYFKKPDLFVVFGCFQNWEPKEPQWNNLMTRSDLSVKFFEKKKQDCVFVGNLWNHWYQSDEMNWVMNRIQKIAKNYKRVITYGGSMGGWAALAFSKSLAASHVVAFCPQVILHEYETFVGCQNAFGFPNLFQVETGVSPQAKILCFYGNANDHDLNAVEKRLKEITNDIGNPNLKLYPVPYKKHEVMMALLYGAKWQGKTVLGLIPDWITQNQENILDLVFQENGEVWNQIKLYGEQN